MRTSLLLASICTVLALSGCGGDDTQGAGGSGGDSSSVHNESAIIKHIGAVDDGSGTDSYTVNIDGAECGIAVVLTSASAVSLYADAGDTVAANPDKTAGVKIIADEEATCLNGLNAALSDFK